MTKKVLLAAALQRKSAVEENHLHGTIVLHTTALDLAQTQGGWIKKPSSRGTECFLSIPVTIKGWANKYPYITDLVIKINIGRYRAYCFFFLGADIP